MPIHNIHFGTLFLFFFCFFDNVHVNISVYVLSLVFKCVKCMIISVLRCGSKPASY